LAAVLSSGVAQAQQILPSAIRTSHPHILAHQEDFDRLKAQLPLVPASFATGSGGTISFQITPVPTQDPKEQTGIFSDWNSSASHLYIRHVASYDTAMNAGLQIELQRRDKVSVASVGRVMIPFGHASTVSVTWDSSKHSACYTIGSGSCVAIPWNKDANGALLDWTPADQDYALNGRPGDVITNFTVRNATGANVFSLSNPDLSVTSAFMPFLIAQNTLVNTLAACQPKAQTLASPKECDVAKGDRMRIYIVARNLALAYKLTGQQSYLTAAVHYLDMLFAVAPLNSGGAWSMGGRVSALGYLYDWLFDEMGKQPLRGDPDSTNYRDKIARTIKATLAAPSTDPNSDDLIGNLCGPQTLRNDSSVFDCLDKPVFEDWDRFARPAPPSIAPAYIFGLNLNAIGESTVGLLAIAGEYPEMRYMVETAYQHYDKGFLKAHGQIAVDGAYTTGFAYGAGGNEFGERLLMWRKALEDTGGEPVFANDWSSKLIYPYIYGQRGNYTFPATGDRFDFQAADPLLGEAALSAAVNNNDMHALAYYQQQVLGQRGTDKSNSIIERLFYPVSGSAESLNSLEKSRRFRQAGVVLMRDSWDYPNAVVLDFKSSSLIMRNHAHMDQNSFGLYYKGPLLLDSGLYDDYDGSHWNNYYTRTVAHNSIVVFDPAERFTLYGTEYSNDGGQWFHIKNRDLIPYPTLEEIGPGNVDHLDGLAYYENQDKYTYTVGNASKAYAVDKLDQNNGYVRSMLFLRPDTSHKPVTVVFDRVQPLKALTATFLLHTANAPSLAPGYQAVSAGQYNALYNPGDARTMTIRNKDGMATVQTLLPQNANVSRFGGISTSNNCVQVFRSSTGSTTPPAGTSSADCRFTVRQRQADGTLAWRNFSVGAVDSRTDLSDVGAYRMEISAPGAPVANQPQYFLHVISVADNDRQTGVAALDSAMRLKANANTEAVLLNGQIIAVFNRDSAPATSLGWVTSVASPQVIVTGLKPNSSYKSSTTSNSAGYTTQLVETPDGSGNVRSSGQGVITMNY
jgi:hypothetical protein